jgi:hypothetical protein
LLAWVASRLGWGSRGAGDELLALGVVTEPGLDLVPEGFIYYGRVVAGIGLAAVADQAAVERVAEQPLELTPL